MDSEQLHPSIKQFKDFISQYPNLVSEIRQGNAWQSYYEKWALLGEDDPFWNQYKEITETDKDENNMELLNKLVKISERVDINKIQKQIGSLNQTINLVQDLLGEFLKTKSTMQRQDDKANLFRLFRD